MHEFEIRPQEIPEAGEGIERAGQQSLDDATFEPGTFVERTGDFQQSEALQRDFTAVVERADILPPDVSLADRQLGWPWSLSNRRPAVEMTRETKPPRSTCRNLWELVQRRM